ncbi:hypothetical protein ABPG72_008999 [Tetrahymena utriculariae]
MDREQRIDERNITKHIQISENSCYDENDTIGKGSFGQVKKGFYINPSTKQKNPAAIKQISYQLTEDKSNKYYLNEINVCKKIQKFQQENGQILQQMHLIEIYEVIQTENCAYIVMEYCEQSLETFKFKQINKRIDIIQATQFIKQILKGIYILHSQKIIHRDLKPDNIFISYIETSQEYIIKIGDFNISLIQESQSPVGTINYMAPEQVQGIANSDSSYKVLYSPKIDIWAIGVIMHEMITGIQLFPGNYPKNVTKDIIKFGSYKAKWEKSIYLNLDVLPADIKEEQRKFLSFYIPWQRINCQNIAYFIDNLLKFKPEERFSADQALVEIEKILQSEELQYALQNNMQKEISQKQKEIDHLQQQSLRYNQSYQNQRLNTNQQYQQQQFNNFQNNNINQFNIQLQINSQNNQNIKTNNFQQQYQNSDQLINQFNFDVAQQRYQNQQMGVNYHQPNFNQNTVNNNNNNNNNNKFIHFNQNQNYQLYQTNNPISVQNQQQNYNVQPNYLQTFQTNGANIQNLSQQMQNLYIQPTIQGQNIKNQNIQFQQQAGIQQNFLDTQTQNQIQEEQQIQINQQAKYFDMCNQLLNEKINNQFFQQLLKTMESDNQEYQNLVSFLTNPTDQTKLDPQAVVQKLQSLISFQKMNIKGYYSNLVTNKMQIENSASTNSNLIAFKTYRLYPSDNLIQPNQKFQELIFNFCKIYDLQIQINAQQQFGAEIKRITYYSDDQDFHYNLDKSQLLQKIQSIKQISINFEYYSKNLEDFLKQIKKRQLDHKNVTVVKEKLIICSIIAQQLQCLHENNIYHGQLNVKNISFCQKQQQFYLNYYSLFETSQQYQKEGLYFEQSYMSPQQLQFQKSTLEDDIWALGAIFHHVLTFAPLFQSVHTIKDLVNKYSQNYLEMYEQAQGFIQSSEEEKKNFPNSIYRAYTLLDKIPNKEMADLINQMLSKDAKQRPKIQEINNVLNKQKLFYNTIEGQASSNQEQTQKQRAQ